ncbi:MAG: hypothetical protein OER80_03540 [Gammaproteobacteria bacterium]|nr:hypothetical protein [Gammaproteobacteria bacterium]
MKYKTSLIIAATLILGGCAPSSMRLDDTYGESVRSMIHNQIADPETAANPDPEAVLGYDGSKGERVLQTHTDNVAKAEPTINNEITLNIGK